MATQIYVGLVDSCHNRRSLTDFEVAPVLTATIVVAGLPTELNPVAQVTQTDSQFIVNYIPLYDGVYQIRIEVDGEAIYGSPFSLTWIDGSECTAYESSKFSSKVLPLFSVSPPPTLCAVSLTTLRSPRP